MIYPLLCGCPLLYCTLNRRLPDPLTTPFVDFFRYTPSLRVFSLVGLSPLSLVAMRSSWLLCALLVALFGLCCGSLVEFHRLDVTSPDFDVDAGLSSSARWLRLQSAASTPLKGWNSYDGWDWSVTERDVILNVDYVAANLSSFGYNIVTIESAAHTHTLRTQQRERLTTRTAGADNAATARCFLVSYYCLHTSSFGLLSPHLSLRRLSMPSVVCADAAAVCRCCVLWQGI